MKYSMDLAQGGGGGLVVPAKSERTRGVPQVKEMARLKLLNKEGQNQWDTESSPSSVNIEYLDEKLLVFLTLLSNPSQPLLTIILLLPVLRIGAILLLLFLF